MARTVIPVQTLSKNDSAAITWTAADNANGNYFINDGKTILLAKNEGAGGARTVTIDAVSDPFGRAVDEEMTVAAFDTPEPGLNSSGFLDPVAWNQLGTGDLGRVHVDCDADTDLYLAALKF